MNLSEIKEFFHKHEKYLSAGALLLGFIVDNFTLTRIDLLLDNLILLGYLLIAGVSILLLNVLKEPSKIKWLLPYLLQYAFGGLFSGFFIFYSRSSSFITSWPFLLALLFLLIGNESFKRRYQKLVFQLGIYFTALFSFFIFFIPVIIGKIGAWVFVLSGLVSLAVIGLFIHLLILTTKDEVQKHKRIIVRVVSIIFILFNILYFTNTIPPLPLALKELGVYYSAERVASNYLLVQEESKWYEFYKGNEFQYSVGDSLSAYSSVFAPTKISGEIFHHWSFFSELEEKWLERGVISFPISGGRDGGFRGYSTKSVLEYGKWRVDVKTVRGQLLGRYEFSVIPRESTLNTETIIR